ncbi:MAG TPA: efflux RND transporter periplasmic adaptor subunit [Salinibacter sp.]|nr:efflux RND transporter periplasmic adaptor subunit [Salinibacter sp.]
MPTDPTTTSPPPRREADAGEPTLETAQPAEIERTLGVGAGRQRRRWGRWAALVLLLLAVGAVATWYFLRSAPPVAYEMVEARRGTLTLSVTATGALAAVTTVEVGSEISGLVEAVLVDVNDRVQRGQVLARLDTDRLRAEVTQAEANRTAARASVEQVRATLDEQRLQTQRSETLAAQAYISSQELETARAALDRAEAAVTSAEAQVSVAEAALDVAQTTLRKAAIRSPIDGLVLSRAVDPGQAVAASFQTPVLFTLAQDLTQMELHVDVDEADVGQVEAGQDATFTVDAYPDRSFPAAVTKVHYASKTVSGVVTYEAVMTVDNADGALRPGMTATATITTDTVPDALLVPNSALRFTPPNATPPERIPGQEVVWTRENDTPVAVFVTPGRTDGQWTAVRAGEVEPGQSLLVNLTRMNE